MLKTYRSKIPYPSEVSEVSTEVVTTLDEENYFTEQFDQPEEAKTLFYEAGKRKPGNKNHMYYLPSNDLVDYLKNAVQLLCLHHLP